VPNPSFERTNSGSGSAAGATYNTWQWYKCNPLGTADMMAGDGLWGVNKAPQHLDYYGMMIMPANSMANIESIGADLSTPFIPCQTYELTIQLANMKNSSSCPGDGGNYSNHSWEIELELYGTNSCGLDELLWESGHITHCDWQQYTATFTPSAAYTQIHWKPKAVNVYALGLPVNYNHHYAVGVDNMSSIVPLNSSVPDTIDVQLCAGDSVFAAGAYQTVSGIYNDTLQTIAGCDSIISTVVNVSPSYNSNTTVNICAGDSVLIGGVYQTIAGIYSDTLQSVGSCDSIISTTLNVSPTYIQNTSIDICNGDSALIGGVYQTVAGIYNDTLQSVSSCDSIISITLNILPAYFYNISVDICNGDSVLIGGVYQTTAGIYNDTVQLSSSCDSVAITTVNVVSAYLQNTSVDICAGDSVFVAGAYQTVSGIYNDTLQSVGSCDSVIITAVNVSPVYTQNTTVNICDGDSVFVGGAYQTVAGSYNDTLQSVNSCDSVIITTVNILPVYTYNTSVDICDGDSVFVGGAYQKIAGSYNDTLQSVTGCDSIIVTAVNVLPIYNHNTIVNICAGDSVFVGGAYQIIGGSYNDTLQSVNTCDSVIVTTVNVLPIYNHNITVNICAGDSVFAGGAYQTIAGSYNDTFQSVTGCDSIVETNVVVLLSSQTNQVVDVCENSVYVFPDGTSQLITTNINQTSNLINTAGCDSIVVTQVNSIAPIVSNDTVEVCSGGSYTFSDGSMLTNIQISQSHSSTLNTQNGCDSILTTSIIVLPIQHSTEAVIVCEGETVVFPDGTSELIAGNLIHTSTLVAQNGCDSVVTTNVSIPIPLLVELDYSPMNPNNFDEHILFQTTTAATSYLWTITTSDGVMTTSNQNSINWMIPENYSGEVVVCLQVENQAGCIYNYCESVFIENLISVFIPNTITPDGDGRNDVFHPVISGVTPEEYQLRIFNRWGEMIFESKEYTEGWDGSYKNQLVQVGTYIYSVKFKESLRRKEHKYNGHVNVIR